MERRIIVPRTWLVPRQVLPGHRTKSAIQPTLFTAKVANFTPSFRTLPPQKIPLDDNTPLVGNGHIACEHYNDISEGLSYYKRSSFLLISFFRQIDKQ